MPTCWGVGAAGADVHDDVPNGDQGAAARGLQPVVVVIYFGIVLLRPQLGQRGGRRQDAVFSVRPASWSSWNRWV